MLLSVNTTSDPGLSSAETTRRRQRQPHTTVTKSAKQPRDWRADRSKVNQ